MVMGSMLDLLLTYDIDWLHFSPKKEHAALRVSFSFQSGNLVVTSE
jgi:hypothetical protein